MIYFVSMLDNMFKEHRTIYMYLCTVCNNEFEYKWQNKCPKCWANRDQVFSTLEDIPF